jgi:hypothetical protein
MQNPYKLQLKTLGLKYKTILGTASAKTIKGEKIGYLTAIIYLKPDDIICSMARTAGCMIGCLQSAGRGAFNSVQNARISKTEYFKNNQLVFMLSLCADIWTMARRADKLGLQLLIRPNGTSDILYENIIVWDNKNIFQLFPDITFYDYTKHPARNLTNKTAGNYDLTYSYSGLTPEKITHKGLLNPHNSRVAVVFMKKADIPLSFNAWPVIDGDNTDVRHIEPKNVVVALYAKGKAKKDNTGFVQSKGIHYA